MLIGFATLPVASAQEQDPNVLYEQALKSFGEGEFEASVLSLRAALAANPNLLPGHLLMARIYLAISEPAAAQDALIRARRLGADPDIVWPLEAEALYRKREYRKLLALAPGEGLGDEMQATVLVLRGRALLKLGQITEATEEFRRAAVLTPAAPLPQASLAIAALREGDMVAAEARALKATQLAPEDADAWSALGEVAHARGMLDEALDAYAVALERAPTHLEARVARAGILLDLGRLEEAAADIRTLRERVPVAPKPAFLEAMLLSKQGDRQRALETLRLAAALLDEMGPAALETSPQLMLTAGLANFELGELEQAQPFLARYVERYPNQPMPRKLLGGILIGTERSAEAVSVLEPALQQAKDDPELLALLARAYSSSGRYDLAVGYLRRAVELDPGSSELRAQLAMARIGDGDEAAGIDELTALFQQDPKANARTGVELASLLIERGQNQRAAEVALALTVVESGNATYLNLLGSAQFAAGRIDAARASFLASIAADRQHLPARVNLALLEVRHGDPADARRILVEILDEHPEHAAAMVEFAELERRAGRSKEALRWLEKAQSADAKSIRAGLALVDLHLELRAYEKAEEVASRVQSNAPEDMRALAAVARVYLAQNRTDLALEIYRRMSLIAAYDIQKLLFVSRLQARAGARGDAIFSLHKALQSDGDKLLVRLALTRLLVSEGRLGQARDQVVALLEKAPGDARVHQAAGDLANAAGELDEAAGHFQTAWNIAPSSTNVLRLFRARVATGDIPLALELLEEWLQGHPDDVEARRAIAETYLAAGQREEALAQYQDSLERRPRDAGLLNSIALILDAMGKEEAMDYARRALAEAPQDPALLDTFGWMLVRRGEPARGLGYLRDAHSRDSSNATIRYHVASALAALDRRDEARRELRIALQSTEPFNGIADARRLLDELKK